ncbi:MAG: TRAP transporter large permease subunit [Clostridiales bacterium]|nr:TRAP transporter large permease subunit [Clostridiales bacterium]
MSGDQSVGKVIRCDSEYITVPIFYPLIKSLGFDGIWFAVLIVVNMELAFITLPVGLNLFVVKGLDKESSKADIIRSVLPFIVLMAIFMVPSRRRPRRIRQSRPSARSR